MPLRDHFGPPLEGKKTWDGFHAAWPTVMVQQLIKVLPEPYFAMPGVHLGTICEVDVGTYRDLEPESGDTDDGDGGVAVATYAPPKATLTLEPELPGQDVYEVRVYDSWKNRRLVAAIEIVSPSNKDRPESRAAFVSKVANLLRNDVCVSIVDIVGVRDFNLYAELMMFVNGVDPALGDDPPPMYAVTLRMRPENRRKMMDNWYHPLALGQPLPTLPVWLTETVAVALELEANYEETCRTLRIR